MDNIMKVSLVKQNEVYLKVDTEEAINRELSSFFTFKVPGAEFTPAYGKYKWDGLIRLYNLRSKQIYVGLLPYMKAFCRDNGYELSYDPSIESTEELSLKEAWDYVNSLDIHSKGNKLEIRDYQVESFLYGIRYRRMLLESPTSSGKSVIQYLIFRYLVDQMGCKKGLLIVPTINLVSQMYGDFEDYSSHNGFDVEANCHKIFEGQEKNSNKVLYISTWQSIYNLPAEYFEQFDFILGDEAHLFKAESLTKIMNRSVNAKFRIGVTGTLDGTKCHKLVLEGVFGRHKKFVSTKELQDKKQIAELTIKCLFLNYSKEISFEVLGSKYKEELDFILAHERRNNFIKNLTLSLEGNTLLLFQYVEKHGVILKEIIERAIAAEGLNKKCYFVFGKTELEEREEIRKIVNENPSGSIIIASYGTYSTGVNIPHIHSIIFTSPTKSRIRVLQSIGRGLRLGEFKNHCTLFDIVDDFSIESATNTTLDHFQERFSYYVGEQFNYKFYNIRIKE